MKTYYLDKPTRSIADVSLCEGGRAYVINRINVPRQYRGRGLGSKLLSQITHDADQECATLILYVQPSGGLTREELQNWYSRNGFIDDGEDYMFRLPKETPQCQTNS